jgi:PAS domain S-box-containing protein
VAVACGAYAVAAGVLALVGWGVNLPRLTDWKGDGISMFPNTAACAVMSGLALLLSNVRRRRPRPIVRLLGAVLTSVAALTLLEHLSGMNIGIDTALFDRAWGQLAAAAPMRMGPPASVSFLLTGVAVLLLTFGEAGRGGAAALGAAIVAIGMLSLTGHLYGASQMYMLPRLTGIALQTASVVVAVGAGLVATVAEREPMRTLVERSAAGDVVRRAFPALVVLSVALGAMRVWIQQHGLVDVAFGTALRTVIELALLTGLLWWAAARVRTHERALHASEAEVRRHAAQLGAFLETAAIGLHRIGPDGTILWVNDAELKMLGYDREEYVGRHIAEFHADTAVIADILARLRRGEKIYDFPARMKCKDGSMRHVVIDSSVLWEDGRFVHTQCLTRDVTERTGAEEVRTLLAAIIQASDDAIISKTLDGIITSWNAGAERIFGYTAAEAVGQRIDLIIPADRLEEERDILARLRRGERIDHFETVRRRKDGALRDMSLTISPIADAHGAIVGASKIGRDITERKRTERRLAADQEALARIYEVGRRCVCAGDDFPECLDAILAAAVWIAGADKGTLQLYDEASGALQLTAHVGFDAPFTTFFAAVDRDEVASCGVALAAGERVIVEDVATSPIFAGQPALKVLLGAGVRAVQSTPLVSSGGTILGMMSTHFGHPHRPSERDCRLLDLLARQAADYIARRRAEDQREALLISAERAREAAERANRAKDEFLAMLGHELRNPLSAVRNAVAAATLDETSRGRALEIARRQTDQLGRIVDDLLDVARITRGRVPLRKKRVALADVLERTVEGARALMDERGHSITLRLPAEPIHMEADAARLEQAVANLLANAAKYTDPGGSVTVSGERDGEDAVIRVRDNGIGIAPDVLPGVFDLFAQGERSLDRAQGGLGIGLTLVRRIVELHGGTVVATSAGIGRGAEFVIRMRALPAGIEVAAAKLVPAPREHHAARVLMVEDNPDAAESLVMILELVGHHVRVVHDGPAALEAARANVPDIMLVDIGLPGMNGYEVARAVRGDAALKHVVLVALTGYGRPDDKAEAMAAGFDYHLVKPVDLDALGELVARLGSAVETVPTRH